MILSWLAGIFDTACMTRTVRKLAAYGSRISLYPFARIILTLSIRPYPA